VFLTPKATRLLPGIGLLSAAAAFKLKGVIANAILLARAFNTKRRLTLFTTIHLLDSDIEYLSTELDT
jgi:hypothetical protein